VKRICNNLSSDEDYKQVDKSISNIPYADNKSLLFNHNNLKN
jgi:hypothetical protein